jgi:hypothetical protein
MKSLVDKIRRSPLLWLLCFVTVVFVVAQLRTNAHSLLFVLSVNMGRLAWFIGVLVVRVYMT